MHCRSHIKFQNDNIMPIMNKPTKNTERLIVQNKKAYHDYFIEDRYEAGIMLEGWEVKSIRAGRVQLKDSYVIIKNNAGWLIGAHISPLPTASTHIHPNPTRSRKLLLHQREINKLHNAKERQGYTITAIDLHWHKNNVKVEIGIAKGKKQHDKREVLKKKAWEREQSRNIKLSK